MQDTLFYTAEYKAQASQTIKTYVSTMSEKMEQIKKAYRQGVISFDQMVVGRTKLLKEAADILHAPFNSPTSILQQLTSALQYQQEQLIDFSVVKFVETI